MESISQGMSGQPAARTSYDFEFTGKAGEYFKIWIVNILLTILTLGIYSAWAKVRNARYFYGNTRVAGSVFEYTADPVAILKGRLIAVGLFVLYSLVNAFLPILGLVMALGFIGLIPWIIPRSLAFNARNSVYRNVRFDFNASYWETFKVFILWPLLMLPTLGLIFPYLTYRFKRYIIDHSSYGQTSFAFDARIGDFYRIYAIAFAALLAVLLIGFATGFLIPGAQFILIPLAYLGLVAYTMVQISNLVLNYSSLGNVRFRSRLETVPYATLMLTNGLAVIISLGLLLPWAKIRLARYRAQCTQMSATDLDSFVAAEQREVGALGEQMGEVFDLEVAL